MSFTKSRLLSDDSCEEDDEQSLLLDETGGRPAGIPSYDNSTGNYGAMNYSNGSTVSNKSDHHNHTGGSIMSKGVSTFMASVNHLRKRTINTYSISTIAKPASDRETSTFLAGWNVSNLIQGTGTLGIPYAVQQTGWAGVVMIIIAGAIGCHTSKLIGNCLYEKSQKTGIRRRLRTDLPDIGFAAWRRPGQIAVIIVQCIEMGGAVVMYLVLLGTAWTDMLSHHIPQLGVKEWAAISCVLTLPTLFIRRVSIISWFSLIAVFSFMISLFLLILFCLVNVHHWRLENMPEFDINKIPIGMAIIVFANCAHPIVASVEGSMSKPKSFGMMLNSVFSLSVCVKIVLAVSVGLMFGRNTKELVTTSLMPFPAWWISINIMIIVNVLLSVPLCMFVITTMFDIAVLPYFQHIGDDTNYHWVWLAMTRPLLVGLVLLLAVVVPHFGLVIAMVGSISGTCLSLILPASFHLSLRWKSMKWYARARDLFIVVFGICVGGFGLFFSGRRLIATFMS